MSKRVLIADDTAYMRAVLREALSHVGLVIVGEADNGGAAVSMYRQLQPDLLILNVMMPELDGIESLKQIRAWDPHAKILMCSAMGQAATVFSAIRCGASDFLVKPFDSKRLIDAICRILSLKFIHPGETQNH